MQLIPLGPGLAAEVQDVMLRTTISDSGADGLETVRPPHRRMAVPPLHPEPVLQG